MQRICIVEDDENIREMIIYALSSADFDAYGFEKPEDFWKSIEKEIPALILLDIMLPDEDGLSILGKLRKSQEYKDIPVIMLTAKGAEYDRIKGLDFGADDYITKPFSVLEVISRIKAVLRRYKPELEADNIAKDDIELFKSKRIVIAGGKEVNLTYKEFELLHYLMLNEGIVLTRDKLLEQVWGFDYNGESRTIDMHIRTLRQKLGDSGKSIKTIRNVGYKIGG